MTTRSAIDSLRRTKSHRGFTIVEILIALMMLMVIITGIYASWISILKGSKIGLDAAKEVQRKRIASRVLQDALMCAQLYGANEAHYAFMADTSNPEMAALSFVADLPDSFPRSGRYGDEKVRRVTFTVEPGKNGLNNLVMRQTPILRLMDQSEEENPLILAKGVQIFGIEFWDNAIMDWGAEWLRTNSIPPLVRVVLASSADRNAKLMPQDVVTRVVKLQEGAVPANLQMGGGNPVQNAARLNAGGNRGVGLDGQPNPNRRGNPRAGGMRNNQGAQRFQSGRR